MTKMLTAQDVTVALRWEYRNNWPWGFLFYIALVPVAYLVAAIDEFTYRRGGVGRGK